MPVAATFIIKSQVLLLKGFRGPKLSVGDPIHDSFFRRAQEAGSSIRIKDVFLGVKNTWPTRLPLLHPNGGDLLRLVDFRDVECQSAPQPVQ